MPYTPENRERALRIIARYPERRSALLPLLHLAQDQDGWLSPDAMAEIAELLGIEPVEVLGVASFYTMYKRDRPRRLVVSVCTNVSCLVNGAGQVHEAVAEAFAADDEILVEEVECLAACDAAPVLQVNYEFHPVAGPEAAVALVEEYRRGDRTARGVSGGRALR